MLSPIRRILLLIPFEDDSIHLRSSIPDRRDGEHVKVANNRCIVCCRRSDPFRSRRRSAGIQAGSRGTLNASHRVPYYSATKGEAKELHTVALGSIFDCTAREAEGGVGLDCGFESSFVAPHQPRLRPVGFPPVLQSRQAHTNAVAPLASEVLMAELDDPTTGNRLQFFVSAERAGMPER